MLDNRSEKQFQKDLNKLASDIVSDHYRNALWSIICKKAASAGIPPEQYWNNMWENCKKS